MPFRWLRNRPGRWQPRDHRRDLSSPPCPLAHPAGRLEAGPGPTQRLCRRGLKPVYRVTTLLGRTIETTRSHPFLTITGWRPLADVQVGEKVAVPRRIPVFGDKRLSDNQVKLLGYLLGDGGLTAISPAFT